MSARLHLSSKVILLLASLLFFQADGFADPISSAIKSLDKGKHVKVESTLTKALDKNPVNPGAYYVYSLLYFDSTYVGCNLDSAHISIEFALQQLPLVDSLEGVPLDKAKLTSEHLIEQKSLVDRAAFSRATEQNTVASFQFFIDNYNNAPQLANAISRRDQLAFEIAARENTHDSYLQFLETYPESHQAPMARKRYDLLVFQSKTENGKLQHFLDFLKEHPNTPYRDQAEWQILRLSTLSDDREDYVSFTRNFPKSKHVRTVNDMLYHLDKQLFMSSGPVTDSLKSVYQLENTSLIPIYEDGKYGFIDKFGVDQVPPVFDSIPEFYLCQLLNQDVLQAFIDEKLVLISRNQKILWEKPFDTVDDLGRGLLKIQQGKEYGILHKSGWLILDVVYNQIEIIDGSFFAIQKDGKWGVASMTGKVILKPNLTSIEQAGAFILMENDGWAVTSKEKLIENFEKDQQIEFTYDDWELVGQNFIMVFTDDKEGLLNNQLAQIIPLSRHVIHELDSADWYVKTSHGTLRFYGEQLQSIPPDRYQDFKSNSHFIGLKREGWEIWQRDSLHRINQVAYDSVADLGLHLMLLYEQGATSVLFQDGAIVKLAKDATVKLIRDADQSKGFLQVTDKGKRQIYDLSGNPIYQTWYYDVGPLTPSLFVIEKNSMKGIVDMNGKVLLKPRYSAIVADSTTHISILHQGRFGYFNPENKAFIRPQYESRLVHFDNGILLSSKKGKQGLINQQNKTLLNFEYDQIHQWTDSTVFALKEDNWQVLNIYTGEVQYDKITGYEEIRENNVRKAIVKTTDGYGLLDNVQGMLLNPGFNDIMNLGTAHEPVFFTEKYIPEADYYVVIYYNHQMDVIRRQVFDSGNYDQVYCY